MMYFISIRLMYLPEKTLLTVGYMQKYGVLYEDLKTKSKKYIFMAFIFVLRRSVVCFVYLYLQNKNYFQIMITLFLNTFFMIYTVSISPYRLKSLNKREMINEFVVLQMTNILMIFTDFVPDRDA